MSCIPVFATALFLGPAASAEGVSAVEAASHVHAELIASRSPGGAADGFDVAVHLRMDPGWHVYWLNPGDAGLATSVRWELPAGFHAGAIRWPAPHRFVQGPVTSYGHDGELWLVSRVTLDSGRPAKGELRAEVSWLECEEACVPGSATLRLTLPEGVSARGSIPDLTARARLSATATLSPNRLRIDVKTKGDLDLSAAYFFPMAEGVFEPSLEQPWVRVPGGWRLEIDRSPQGSSPKRLEGVLVAGETAWALDAEVSTPRR